MARVICHLPNASENISGVRFEKVDAGMLSEDIADDRAAEFVAIPGYAMHSQKTGDELALQPEDDKELKKPKTKPSKAE